jgi:hypothetical protein
VYVS